MWHIHYPPLSPWLCNMKNAKWREHVSWCSLCNFVSSLHYFLPPISNTLSLCSTLDRNQVLYPHKTTLKIIALYILNFTFLHSTCEDSDFRLNGSRNSWNLICTSLHFTSLHSTPLHFINSVSCVTVVPRYLNSATFSEDLLPILMIWLSYNMSVTSMHFYTCFIPKQLTPLLCSYIIIIYTYL